MVAIYELFNGFTRVHGEYQITHVNERGKHDGRARTIEEAILWHGGEAQRSRDAFATMSADERAAMLAFLSSL
jgi:CxxC motif-containing protein (DUF1111 family)